MTVINVGDMQMMDGAKFPGIVIQASREELQAVAGDILYKEVEVLPVESGADTHRDIWDETMEKMVDALVAVDRRVREAKPSRKYTRAEVLAMLDEIDPEDRTKGGTATA